MISSFAVLWFFLSGLQQVADTNFRPPIERPAYAPGKGPVVLIDEAHSNFHTAAGRYLPFAELLRRDGYIVKASTTSFTPDSLREAAIVVISNARNPKDDNMWNPPHLSAFTTEEINALRDWVSTGGSLLLIADHPPYSGAAIDLAKAFGIHFSNTYARDPQNRNGRLIFRRSDGTLAGQELTRGIDEIATFTGSSFRLETPGQPLLIFGDRVRAFGENDDPNSPLIKGHLQGAVLTPGKGRMAVFGEAAMFSAQVSGPDRLPMGMNDPIAKQNPALLLKVIHWLSKNPN